VAEFGVQPAAESEFLPGLRDGRAADAEHILCGTVVPITTLVWQAEAGVIAGGVTIDSNNAGFNGTGFANFPVTGGSLQWNNVDGGSVD